MKILLWLALLSWGLPAICFILGVIIVLSLLFVNVYSYYWYKIKSKGQELWERYIKKVVWSELVPTGRRKSFYRKAWVTYNHPDYPNRALLKPYDTLIMVVDHECEAGVRMLCDEWALSATTLRHCVSFINSYVTSNIECFGSKRTLVKLIEEQNDGSL